MVVIVFFFQTNSSDCGLHLLENTFQLIENKFQNEINNWKVDLGNVENCRSRLKTGIAQLAKESSPVSRALPVSH